MEELVSRAGRDPYRIMTDVFSSLAEETERFRQRYGTKLHWTVGWAVRERALQALEPYILRIIQALADCGLSSRISPEATAAFLTHGVGSTIMHESRADYSDKASELRRGVNLLMGISDEEGALFSPYYAGYSDIPALIALFSREKELFSPLAQSGEKLLPARISEREIFVLRKGRQLAGAILFSREYKSLDALLVAPEYRRLGGAERLCDSALAQFDAGEELRVLGSVPEGGPVEALLKKFALYRTEGGLTVTAPEKWRVKHHDA